ncbi:TPA: DUF4956 domain-containing protein [Candidatus Poribacteria bacterium]|nr:DUF4956 domain-containing protein [Candidatus Poribacteria bacterium]
MNIFDNLSLNLQFASWRDIVINILIAFVLGLVISWVYRRTHRGFSYSASFVHTLMLLCMITSLVMMVIGNSIARAFSLVGALSIIRFRTPVKDTRDTAFVFFALAIGMATGTGAHLIAIVGAAIISLIILIIHRFRLGEIKGSDFLLRFRLRTSPDNDNAYQDIFNRYLRKNTLINMTTLEQGASMELAFSITFKKSYQQGEFLRELNDIGEIENAMLIAADEGEIS